MSVPSNIAVIGAGIVGLSTALGLQRLGLSVTLIDRDEPGSGTSFGNAGVFADRGLDDSRTQRYIEMPDESDTAFYLPMATANTYIAVEHIVLTATALGLGSCWVGGISDLKAIRDMLGIPRGIFVHGLVAVGFTDSEPKARPRLPLDDLLLRSFPA